MVVLRWPSQADLAQLSAPTQGQAPELLAVQVVYSDDSAPVGPDYMDARVLVDLAWGNARAPLEATIDCGQTVVLAATSLRAAVRTMGTSPTGQTRVRFMVSIASSANAHAPTFTDRSGAMAPGASSFWDVPPWARAVSVAYTYDPTIAANVVLLEWMPPIGAGGLIASQASGGALLSSSRVLVPRGARVLKITNGAIATRAQPIWELAL